MTVSLSDPRSESRYVPCEVCRADEQEAQFHRIRNPLRYVTNSASPVLQALFLIVLFGFLFSFDGYCLDFCCVNFRDESLRHGRNRHFP